MAVGCPTAAQALWLAKQLQATAAISRVENGAIKRVDIAGEHSNPAGEKTTDFRLHLGFHRLAAADCLGQPRLRTDSLAGSVMAMRGFALAMIGDGSR